MADSREYKEMGGMSMKKRRLIYPVVILSSAALIYYGSKPDKHEAINGNRAPVVVETEIRTQDGGNEETATEEQESSGSYTMPVITETAINEALSNEGDKDKSGPAEKDGLSCDIMTPLPSVTQTNVTVQNEVRNTPLTASETITPAPTKTEAAKISGMVIITPTPLLKAETTPIPVKSVTPILTTKADPTPVPVKSDTPTTAARKNNPTPTCSISPPAPVVKADTPTPTASVHVCSEFETISKTITVPMTFIEVDRGPYDEEVICDQVFWCTSCNRSEYDLGYRTYDMLTGRTIWEDYDGFCEHCSECWHKTGKGGSWNDFRQQVINVIHYDHCWGKEVVPEHEEAGYGRKCTVCGEEYW
ncbi:MAG: hypothetical protein J6M24_04730 [Lachnospiraceae bacterium]|nr:hypothetical protein [Lachnospiraceae bacterium]